MPILIISFDTLCAPHKTTFRICGLSTFISCCFEIRYTYASNSQFTHPLTTPRGFLQVGSKQKSFEVVLCQCPLVTSSSGSLCSCCGADDAPLLPLLKTDKPLVGGEGVKVALDSKMSRPLSFWLRATTGWNCCLALRTRFRNHVFTSSISSSSTSRCASSRCLDTITELKFRLRSKGRNQFTDSTVAVSPVHPIPPVSF